MKIIWRELARESLNHARGYIAQQNPEAANRIAERILEVVELVASSPEIGHNSPRYFGAKELRATKTNYIIIYTTIEDVLFVHAIEHQAQNKN